MGLENILHNGGKVLVVGGLDKHIAADYRDHPQFVFWSGEDKDLRKYALNNSIPQNIKAVLFSRFINHDNYSLIASEARDKRIPIFPMLNNGEIKRTLNEILEGVKKTVNHEFVEDKIVEDKKEDIKMTEQVKKTFTIPYNSNAVSNVAEPETPKDFCKKYSTNELNHPNEARRLLKLAEEKGRKFTFSAMYQAVLIYRKRNGITYKEDAPKVASGFKRTTTKKEEETSKSSLIELIDDAIAAIQLVRSEVKKLDSQSADYLRLKDKLSKLLK